MNIWHMLWVFFWFQQLDMIESADLQSDKHNFRNETTETKVIFKKWPMDILSSSYYATYLSLL